MIKHADSHLDHKLPPAVIAYILTRFADRNEFFIETFELPTELGKVQCGLYGPMMGDQPTPAAFKVKRGNRAWASPVIVAPHRATRMVTVIAGPHEGHACVLFTAYAGPQAPQEPDDPGCRNVPESRRFWDEHALAVDTLENAEAVEV